MMGSRLEVVGLLVTLLNCVSTSTQSSNITTTYPPSNWTTTYQPSNWTTTYPPSNWTTTQPPSNWTTTYPPSNWTTTYQPSNWTTTYPPSNWTTTYQPSNWTTTYPPSNWTTTYQPSNWTTTYPPSNWTTTYPPSNWTTTYQPSNWTTTYQPSNWTTTPLVTSSPWLCDNCTSNSPVTTVPADPTTTPTTTTTRAPSMWCDVPSPPTNGSKVDLDKLMLSKNEQRMLKGGRIKLFCKVGRAFPDLLTSKLATCLLGGSWDVVAPDCSETLENLVMVGSVQASMSSELSASYPASCAINGNTERPLDKADYGGEVCLAHTQKETDPWLLIDLGQSRQVSEVVIYRRGDCCKQRMKNFEVRVGSSVSETGALCSRRGDVVYWNPKYRGSCPTVITGRYVTLTFLGHTALATIEVQVYGTTT